MSTHLFPISAYPPVQQDPIPSESSDKWSLAAPLGIIAITVLFMIYRMLVSEDSSPSKGSFDGKVVSKEAPLEPEKVLCIIRIFRAALEKNPGYDRIPLHVEMNAETRGQRLDLRGDIVLSQGEDYVDIASFLPINQKVWIEIKHDQSRTFHSIEVKSNPTLYQIMKPPTEIPRIQLNPLQKVSYTIPDFQYHTEYTPLPPFETHPTIALQQEQQGLQKKKIVISNARQMTMTQGDQLDSLVFENQSDRNVVVYIELKHLSHEPIVLTYSLKRHVKLVPPKMAAKIKLAQSPKPMHVPLEQIIKDYQAAYLIKHQKELLNPRQEDFSLISMNYVHYQES